MNNFTRALKAEIDGIDRRIVIVEKRLADMEIHKVDLATLKAKRERLTALMDEYGAIGVAPAKPKPAPKIEMPVAPLAPVVAKIIDPPRPAAPDVLAPKPKPMAAAPAANASVAVVASDLPAALTVAPTHPSSHGGVPAPKNLQRQHVLAEADGMKACLFPSQVFGPNGKVVDVTELQSCMVSVLIGVIGRGMPEKSIVDRSYALAKRRSTSGSIAMVSYEMRTLTTKLAPAGIKIVHTKGMGYSILAA